MATDEVSVRVSADVADLEGGIKKTVSGVDDIAESSRRLADALAATNETAQSTSVIFGEIAKSCSTMAAAAEVLNQHFQETSNTVATLTGSVGALEQSFTDSASGIDQAGKAVSAAAIQTDGLVATSKQAAVGLDTMAASTGHLNNGLVETAAVVAQTGRQFNATTGGIERAGKAVEEMAARSQSMAATGRQASSGLDAMAASSQQLRNALGATGADSHDVDVMFKQITGSCKNMADAAKGLNQSFREGIVPVSDLNS